jgi:hypothetical protein
LLYNVKPETKF